MTNHTACPTAQNIEQESDDIFDESEEETEESTKEGVSKQDNQGCEMEAAATLTSLVISTPVNKDTAKSHAEQVRNEFAIPEKFTKSGRKRAVPFTLKVRIEPVSQSCLFSLSYEAYPSPCIFLIQTAHERSLSKGVYRHYRLDAVGIVLQRYRHQGFCNADSPNLLQERTVFVLHTQMYVSPNNLTGGMKPCCIPLTHLSRQFNTLQCIAGVS